MKLPDNFYAMSDDFDELNMLIEEAVTVALNQEGFNEEHAQLEAEKYKTAVEREVFIAGARWQYDSLEQQLACVLVNNGKLKAEHDRMEEHWRAACIAGEELKVKLDEWERSEAKNNPLLNEIRRQAENMAKTLRDVMACSKGCRECAAGAEYDLMKWQKFITKN